MQAALDAFEANMLRVRALHALHASFSKQVTAAIATAFNLGWMLARKNKNVLLVDCDPQCNLTGMVLGLENLETADSIQGTKNGKPLNIKEGLAPAFESRPTPIQPVDCILVPKNKRLFLMPGHIGLAEYEVTLGH
jgi:cellulose biosynthesis protein BcsQ